MDDAEFIVALEKCIASGVSVQALADEFKVSELTISRWRGGTVPNKLVYKHMHDRLLVLTQQTTPT